MPVGCVRTSVQNGDRLSSSTGDIFTANAHRPPSRPSMLHASTAVCGDPAPGGQPRDQLGELAPATWSRHRCAVNLGSRVIGVDLGSHGLTQSQRLAQQAGSETVPAAAAPSRTHQLA